jgi:NADPH:quinone reductase-like Zn-dependent oxidoreductase
VTAMRAVVLARPGSVDGLELRELEIPTPKDHEILVRIRTATVTRGDVALRRVPRLMWPLLRIGMGLRRKRILGHEFACSTANVELVASLGATTVIDYTATDYAASHAAYDVVMDAAGKTSRGRARAVLADGRRYVTVRSAVRERAADLVDVAGLQEQGAIQPVIDRCYSLERIREAHRYVEGGHKVGNVVITVDGNSTAPRSTGGRTLLRASGGPGASA